MTPTLSALATSEESMVCVSRSGAGSSSKGFPSSTSSSTGTILVQPSPMRSVTPLTTSSVGGV